MPTFASPRRLALSTLLLACTSSFSAPLVGRVQDVAGHPIAGALVVGSSDTARKDANGSTHRWIASSDAAGRFALDDFPAGPCHVTANAGAAGVGQEQEPCNVAAAAATTRETTIVVAAVPAHVAGTVLRPATAGATPDDVVLVARMPAGEDGPLVVYGTRIEHDAWALDLPAGTWMAKAVTPAAATGSFQFVLPGRTAPIALNLATPKGSHPELARELGAMAAKDQAVRNAAIAAGNDDKAANAAMERVDRANLARLRQIIRRFGWPTGALVGNAGMGDVWLLVQHSPGPFIAQALPHLKNAADRGEIAWSTLALTIDRDLTDRRQPQLYGSQATLGADGRMTLLPVRDEAHLDERRAQVGLGPIADYLAQLQKMYEPPRHE